MYAQLAFPQNIKGKVANNKGMLSVQNMRHCFEEY